MVLERERIENLRWHDVVMARSVTAAFTFEFLQMQ